MLSKEQLIIFSLIATMPLISIIPAGVAGTFFFFMLYYMPITLSFISVMLLSFTRLSNSRIVMIAVIPGALYTIYILYEWLSGNGFGLS